MARRVSPGFKNLDDSFRIYNFLTLKSALWVIGVLVGAFYIQLISGNWLGVGLWTLLLGPRKGALFPFFLAGVSTLALHHLETKEDEHFLGALVAYYRAGHRRFLYSGAVPDGAAGRSFEGILAGRRKS